MDYADIRLRHAAVFNSGRNSASHGQQSLPGSHIGGSTSNSRGIKRNVAAHLLETVFKEQESDSSLSDIGKRAGSSRKGSTSRSGTRTSSQLGFIPQTNRNADPRKSLESSNGSGAPSKAKLSTTVRVAGRQPSTGNYVPNTSGSTKVWGQYKPHAPAKGRQNNPSQVKETSGRGGAPATPQSSDEKVAVRPTASMRAKTKSKGLDEENKGREKAVSDRKHTVDTCPYAAPKDGIYVDSFLFTPPPADEASAASNGPLGCTTTEEDKNACGTKQSLSSSKDKAIVLYPKLPDFKRKSKDNADKPRDRQKSTMKDFEYNDDIDNDSLSTMKTISQLLSVASTATFEEPASKAKIPVTPLTIHPKTRQILGGHTLHGTSLSDARASLVNRDVKSGSSAVNGGESSHIARKPSHTEEYDGTVSGSTAARSSSPVVKRRRDGPKAKPAVSDKPTSSKSVFHKGIEQISDSKPLQTITDDVTSRERRIEKEIPSLPLPSSYNRNARSGRGSKDKHRVTDLTTSSPDKPYPITLSSGLYDGADEEEEDSITLAPGSTLRKPSRVGYSSPKAPISSLQLEQMYSPPTDRGKPSPVIGKRSHSQAKEDRQTGSRSSAIKSRVMAKPAVSAHAKPTRPMGSSTLEKSSQTPRLVSATSSTKASTAVVSDLPSATKKRTNGLAEGEPHYAERGNKRRSVEREVTSRLERSETPPEETQVLWRKAAYGDSFDLLRDDAIQDSESDSDADILPSIFRETVLCPFCDRGLPAKPSERLKDQLEQLCMRVDLQVRASDMNSLALYLPANDTALTCKRHRDESEIIPAGEAAGYPAVSSVNWKKIKKRIKRGIVEELTQIILGRTKSTFLDSARQEWVKSGSRKMNNVRNDYSSFYLELPGYYGQQGLEVIIQVLTSELVSKEILTPSRSDPLDMEVYLRRVLVPETAIRLIQADQDCSLAQARKILEESREYGAAVFSDVDSSDPNYRESRHERGQRRKEEEDEASQREVLLSSQGPEAQALRTGQAFIAKLRDIYD